MTTEENQNQNSRLWLYTGVLAICLMGFIAYTFYRGSVYIVSAEKRADISRLKTDVLGIVNTTVPRDYANEAGLMQAAQYIQKQWEAAGYVVEEQPYMADGHSYKNLMTSFGPKEAPRIVIGAHYDVADAHPGADDNASGVAGLLELSRLLQERQPKLNHRVDLVAYTLEEPPFFATSHMGSAVHAKSLKEAGVQVQLMLSLEMIGFYSDAPDSQKFPISSLGWIYPTTGNFIGVIGDFGSPFLVRRVKNLIRNHARIHVEGLAAPKSLVGIDFSDHRNYWIEGYPALMITDTAFYRNPNYHEATDTQDTLSYERMAEVVEGLYGVVTKY